MNKITLITSATIVMAILIGCGDDSSTTTTTTETNTSTGSANGNTNSTGSANENTNSTACVIDGNTVVGTNGTTCLDGTTEVVCSASGRVTVANTFTGNTVSLNGRTYSCQ